MNRRGFLKGIAGIIAAQAAPYVVTSSGVLMPVRTLIKPEALRLWGDGQDQAAAGRATLPRSNSLRRTCAALPRLWRNW